MFRVVIKTERLADEERNRVHYGICQKNRKLDLNCIVWTTPWSVGSEGREIKFLKDFWGSVFIIGSNFAGIRINLET